MSPIRAGRTLRPDGHPLVAPPWRPERAEIVSEGLDVVVRLYGPALNEVTSHPEAPDDPVHTWVRVRPRDTGWRVVVTGLATLSLPAPTRVAPTAVGFENEESLMCLAGITSDVFAACHRAARRRYS